MTDDLIEYAGISEAELASLLALVGGTEITELKVAYGARRVVLRRPGAEAAPAPATSSLHSVGEHEAPGADDTPLAITSPLVGVFQPTVRIGDHVAHGQPIGAIEAMGVPTSVDAPREGIVEELLVPAGGPVEYGQALLILSRLTSDRNGRR